MLGVAVFIESRQNGVIGAFMSAWKVTNNIAGFAVRQGLLVRENHLY